MNTENEKKWFVYVGDHHEGPFTPREVHSKHAQGLVSKESYVWSEGMPDWLMLSEVKELSQALRRLDAETAPVPVAESPVFSKSTSQPSLKLKEKTGFINAPAAQPTKAKTVKPNRWPAIAVASIILLVAGMLGGLSMASRLAPEELHTRMRPLLSRVAESAPFLTPLFKLVPNLPDVNPDELHELELARTGLPENGVKISIASSLNDANRPVFYLSTNLPDRTKFDLYLVGISESLLNRLQFSTQSTITAVQGFGKSETILAEGGQLIPKGEYRLYVVEANEQPDAVKAALATYPNLKPNVKTPPQVPESAHFLLAKTYFLGGPRDETYLTRLKAFHEKIKQTSQRELQELKQYADTLNMQFSSMSTEFTRIYQNKKASPALRANWKKDAATWTQINTQLDQTIQTWSKETLQNEFFYGKIYQLVKNAYESVKALFQLEDSFVETNPDRGGFDIAHAKALSEARESLEVLGTKMNLINNAPTTPSGIPTRDGL